eukprot:scaffold143182_cov77-Cyclotella_meneghiniana.AAC.2
MKKNTSQPHAPPPTTKPLPSTTTAPPPPHMVYRYTAEAEVSASPFIINRRILHLPQLPSYYASSITPIHPPPPQHASTSSPLHYPSQIKARRWTSCSYATGIRILGTVTLISPQDSRRAAYCSSVFILVINCSVSLADGLLRATKALNRLSSIAAVRVLSRLRIRVTAFAR